MTLSEQRSTWRPKLGRDARWIVWLVICLAFISIVIRPEAAVAVVSLTGLILGYVASLVGIRQWGKNAGIGDD